MRSHDDALLAPLTTLRIGGPAERILEPETEQELHDAVRETWAEGGDWFVLGGGSNVVMADEGVEGTVIRVATTGIAPVMSMAGTARVRVQAGHSWDDFVRCTVEQGWAGVEALSGVPGSVGASPIQNIGAYGQEVESSIVSLDFLDAGTGQVRRMQRDELQLSYRSSVFKKGLEGVVLSVTFELTDAGDGLSTPVAYAQLASALGVSVGERAPLADVRAAVLSLRASKGMVLDPDDPDSVSAGSFFTNPIVTEWFARTLPGDAPRWQVEPDEPDVVVPLDLTDGMEIAPSDDRAASTPTEYHVKLSAAWLIEHAGIRRGFALPGGRAAISTKHTLAIVNRGGATADEVGQLARYVQGRVLSEFGVLLLPEPLFVGHSL